MSARVLHGGRLWFWSAEEHGGDSVKIGDEQGVGPHPVKAAESSAEGNR